MTHFVKRFGKWQSFLQSPLSRTGQAIASYEEIAALIARGRNNRHTPVQLAQEMQHWIRASQTLSGGSHLCFTPRPSFIERQTNKNPSKCSPGEGIFLSPFSTPWAQRGKAKWTTFWVIVNVKVIRKMHVLSGIKCWLIEVTQLQHQHQHPNNDFLAERGYLDLTNILSTAMTATLPSERRWCFKQWLSLQTVRKIWY